MRYSLVALVVAFTVTEASRISFTRECIRKAAYNDCATFNTCCDLHCGFYRERRSTCTIDRHGNIGMGHTECICSTNYEHPPLFRQRRMSRVDVIAGILLLFVVDMLVLSFTF